VEDHVQIPSDWWKTFFSGVVVDTCKVLPPELTRSEADFIAKALQVPPPARLLDVPCGAGRHTIELARRGYKLTGVDLSPECLKVAAGAAAEQHLEIAWRHGNMQELPAGTDFDGAFCFGNSFGFGSEEEDQKFLAAVHGALRPGARFALDTKSAETIFPRFLARPWFEVGDLKFLENQEYDPVRGRIDTEYTLIVGDRTEKRAGSERLYIYRQIHQLLAAAGFGDIAAYGSLRGDPFRLGSERLLIVAVRC